MNDTEKRKELIQKLLRASAGIRAEPSMAGSVGRYVGPITLDNAVAAMEEAVEYLSKGIYSLPTDKPLSMPRPVPKPSSAKKPRGRGKASGDS